MIFLCSQLSAVEKSLLCDFPMQIDKHYETQKKEYFNSPV